MTKYLRRLRGLPARERRLLVEAAFLLWAIRLALWFVPLRLLRRGMALSNSRAKAGRPDRDCIRRVAWAVRTASRFTPSATCLTQALAAEALLRRMGQLAALRIGVAKGEGRPLQAHAWVEGEGGVIVGASADISNYTVLSRRGDRKL
jgi:hypothetical protein